MLGVLLLGAVLLYVPPIATFVGTYVGPGQLWRLAWPIPLAALLTVGWMTWNALTFLKGRLENRGAAARVASFLPLVVVGVLAAASAPAVAGGIEAYKSSDETKRKHQPTCNDPVFRWMGRGNTEPGVVLARDEENSCIAAYSAAADVVSLRGKNIIQNRREIERATSNDIEVPQRALDVQSFSSTHEVNGMLMEILSRYKVGYVLVYKGGKLDADLRRSPDFVEMDNPDERYRLYEVRLR